MTDQIIHHPGGTSFVGKKAVNVLACITVASAMRMYARTGIKANRAYTPTAMLAFVHEQTGKRFKRTQLAEAADYLTDFAKAQRVTLDERTEA